MKQKKKVFIYATRWDWCDEVQISINDFERTSDKDQAVFLIETKEISVTVPDEVMSKLTQSQIEGLGVELEKAKADAHIKIKSIEDKIQSLKAIEGK